MSVLKIAIGVLLTIGTVLSFTAPPAASFMEPDLARMIFWHLPNAFASIVFLFAASWFSLRYLQTKDEKWDPRAAAANEIALMTGLLTLATGIVFSKVQWGNWWDWDPRQTSFLFYMLFVGAYFALRAAFDDPSKRAANSAAYSLATLLPLLFIIFVFPRLPSVESISLHPNVAKKGGGFDSHYWTGILSIFVPYAALCAILYRLRVRTSELEQALDESHGELALRDHSAVTRVVRPVPVPEQDRQEGP